MTTARTAAKIKVDRAAKHQKIDGFGVNINSKYWDGGLLAPVVDLLIDDLGATLFRLDGYGRADWVDPTGELGREAALNQRNYDRIYRTADFQNALGMALYMNRRGIEPYITISGIVPPWMRGKDDKTLIDYAGFADMAVNYIAWLKSEGVRFTLFGPLNETDLGPPEGPLLTPEEYVRACEALIEALDRYGMSGVRLVVAEQAFYNISYAKALLASEALHSRIAIMAMHAYSDYHADDLMQLLSDPRHASIHAWMSEFGDHHQSIEHEERTAWVNMERLMRLLSDGMHGAMSWDAYDNYHDHDYSWTCFGLLMNARNVFTPKKRYYALKHIFRFVRPGFTRIDAHSSDESIAVLAFAGENGELTVVGMNSRESAVALDLDLGLGRKKSGLDTLNYQVYRTCSFEDCACVTTPIVKLINHDSRGVEFTALAGSIFTITNVK